MGDFVSPTPEDLGLYLDLSEVSGSRANMMLDLATALATAVVSPLPAGARAIVLSAAARAYANPQNITYEVIGPMSVTRPPAGLYLTRSEMAMLKRMSGRGGAFTIDPTPATATPVPTWPLSWSEGRYGWWG